MKQVQVTNLEVKDLTSEIARQCAINNFRPDVVVGLVRGGSLPACYLSHYFNVPCILINKTDTPFVPIIYSRVLVVDDINDTGSALEGFCDAVNREDYDMKFATLISNEASRFEVDYAGKFINKLEDPQWVVFPWENWWVSYS